MLYSRWEYGGGLGVVGAVLLVLIVLYLLGRFDSSSYSPRIRLSLLVTIVLLIGRRWWLLRIDSLGASKSRLAAIFAAPTETAGIVEPQHYSRSVLISAEE